MSYPKLFTPEAAGGLDHREAEAASPLWSAGPARPAGSWLVTTPAKQAAILAAWRVYRRVPLPISTRRSIAGLLIARVPGLVRAWRSAVTDQAMRDVGVVADAVPCRRAFGRPRALIVEHRIPTPDRTSGSTRLQAIIDCILSRGWAVTVASAETRDGYHWILDDVGAELPRYEAQMAARDIDVLFGNAAITSHLRSFGRDYELVVLSYPDIMHQYAPIVRATAPGALLAYDTVDLHGLRFRREAVARGHDGADLAAKADRYDAIESAGVDSADVTIAVTSAERGLILERSPNASVFVVPNIHVPRTDVPPFGSRSGMLFIGHYLHTPNEDAMRYFVAEVLPRVQRRIGQKETLFMLGSSMTDAVKSLAAPDVSAVGWVQDPVPWFDRCRVFVAPLRFGAGMKGKIGQAMSLGLPVVTTSIGAEGMMIERGVHAMVEDDAEAFAEAVARVYLDQTAWEGLSTNGLAHIDAHLSPAVAGKAIDDVLSMARIRCDG